ncbi:MAG TPA: hypothetical protein V6C69_21060 [Trichormus sp.]
MTESAVCRHEYVRIYQRKLKGLDRRLVVTRAYLPVGFKPADFGHLGEGSFCFCSKCRARLYPRRTQAEKLAARVALAQGKADAAEAAAAELQEQQDRSVLQELAAREALQESGDALQEPAVDIHVEELELEAADIQDIEAEGVKLSSDENETCSLNDEDQ